MGLFQAFDISASGMTAERFRMDSRVSAPVSCPLFSETRSSAVHQVYICSPVPQALLSFSMHRAEE